MATAVARDPLRVRRRAPDGELEVKLRVAHLVESADLEPRELSPAAVLIVRRLPDPLPHALRSGTFALSPSQRWEHAARTALADVARRAARPAHEAVPANAAAVLFADQAELLACFSRDYLRGQATSLWWWRAILRSFPSGARVLLDAWRRDIRYVPATVAQLSRTGDAAWVLNSFTPQQAWTVLQDLARCFGLDFLLGALQQPWDARMQLTSPGEDVGSHTVQEITSHTRRSENPVPSAPWSGLCNDAVVPAGLGMECSALLGVSLALCHSLTTVRSRKFAAAFALWRQVARFGRTDGGEQSRLRTAFLYSAQDPATADVPQSPPGADLQEIETGRMGLSELDHQSTEIASPAIDLFSDVQATLQNPTAISNREDAKDPNLNHAEPTSQSESNPPPSLADPAEVRTSTGAPSLDDSYKPAARMLSIGDQTSEAPLASVAIEEIPPVVELENKLQAGDGVATELGGVLFLVNIIRSLHIPEAIEEACSCEFGLGSWEYVELIARCLLGPNQTVLSHDPVWDLLLLLDGRPMDEAAGRNFSLANSYRLPASWIAVDEVGSTSPALRIRNDRLEAWHALGFPLAFQPLDGPPSTEQIAEFAGPSAVSFLRRAPDRWAGAGMLGLAPGNALRLFLAFLMPFIRWRLAEALGMRDARQLDVAKALLLRPGTIWVTSTHIDLTMNLNQASAPVRFAGLDADPSWVPELARVIKFHYQ